MKQTYQPFNQYDYQEMNDTNLRRRWRSSGESLRSKNSARRSKKLAHADAELCRKNLNARRAFFRSLRCSDLMFSSGESSD